MCDIHNEKNKQLKTYKIKGIHYKKNIQIENIDMMKQISREINTIRRDIYGRSLNTEEI